MYLESAERYTDCLGQEPEEVDALFKDLLIGVTQFFRDPESFDHLAKKVIPQLFDDKGPEGCVRIWVPGCASGEEPYSLAILFHQFAAARGQVADASRVQVVASDIDRASLDAARRGQFTEPAFADTPIDLRRRYFSVRPPFEVAPEIRPLVSFERRDLIVDPSPAGMHLIACRNVLIYFDRTTQENLFQRFYDALAPGGFLVLGKVETLLGPTRSLFSAVDPRERIFRRR